MRVPRSVFVVRVASLLGLLVSAALTADALHPDRAFCPLEAACAKARSSAMGAFFGVPTSILGILAFGGLFALTLLPARLSRRLGRPAAWLGALMGLAFVAYQAFWLGSFCPLCLLADAAGLAVGAAAFTWPPPPVTRGRRKLQPEPLPGRLRWGTAALLAVLLPLCWPRADRPSWVPVPTEALGPELAEGEDPPMPSPEPSAPPPAWTDDARRPLAPEPEPTQPWIEPGDELPRPPSMPRPDLPAAPPRPAPEPVAPPPPPPPPPPVRVAPRVLPRETSLVEYLNPYCAHCRATHARLERTLATFDASVRRRRVYVWATAEPPLWARACAYAETVGLGEALFAELLRTDGQDDRSVREAARRVGIEPADLRAGLSSEATTARLDANQRAMRAARIQGLPTLDIGRRRLMGEQSEAEILDALRATL